MQALTSPSMRRTMSSRAWYWEDTMPMKIWPLRACMQSSFSSTSPIPSSGRHKAQGPAKTRPSQDTQEPANSGRRPGAAYTDAIPKSRSTQVTGDHERTKWDTGRSRQTQEKRQWKALISLVTILRSSNSPALLRARGLAPPWATASARSLLGRKTPCLVEWGVRGWGSAELWVLLFQQGL